MFAFVHPTGSSPIEKYIKKKDMMWLHRRKKKQKFEE